MSHGNARLTPAGRLLLVRRVAAGEPQAEVARQMRLSRGTVAKWWGRWVEHGDAGLVDRSSRPNRSPRRTDAATEERICRLRRSTKRGPVYLSARTGVPASTVWRVLCRHGLNRLDRLDRPTGRTIRRYEKAAPGELVHLDIKKVAKVPPGGGWRVHGRGSPKARRSRRSGRSGGGGYTYLHVAVDDYSRVAYVEACDNETATTLAGFWTRAQDWFWANDMPVDAVMTDNGANFCSGLFAELLARRRIAHLRTRPYRPRLTAKPSASTAPSPRNSSTPGASDPKTNGASASSAGSVTTTATDTTPQSAARPHHALTTSRELTASRRGFVFGCGLAATAGSCGTTGAAGLRRPVSRGTRRLCGSRCRAV